MNFDLPKELIAQEPSAPRDHCRLMVLDKKTKTIKHDRFFNVGDYLRKGDVLVFNDSKVFPARLIGMRDSSKREVLLLKEYGEGEWEVLIGGKIKAGDVIDFSKNLSCEIVERREDVFVVRFNKIGLDFLGIVEQIGLTPTPPYIKQLIDDPEKYQTVYAKDLGSAAAPTAGLHFTQELLDKLADQGIQQEFITLHVGLGTFQPIKTDKVEDHQIHTEWYSVDPDTLQRLKDAKQEGRRIIAVGTTSVRVLETIFDPEPRTPSPESRISSETSIFIYPGYQFKAVDAMITNFHTPYSSLLALVYAFTGQDFIKDAYQEAIEEQYRFFSFGDVMFIQ